MRAFLLFLFLFLLMTIAAQSAAEADALFNKREYREAAQQYAVLLQRRPNDALFNYRYARCSYELGDYQAAIQHFQRSGNRYPLKDYYLGDSYFWNYQFSEAIQHFTLYAAGLNTNPQFLNDIEDKMRRATMGQNLMRRVEDIAIIDSIIVSKQDFLKHFELSRETGTFRHELVKNSKNGTVDLISFVTQRGDRKFFSDTTAAGINLFTANRLLEGWSKPESINAVNSSANENYPFLMLDGVTLYFASDGPGSIGGYDIFVTRFAANINDYLSPENIGMPFNSLYNDYMFVVDEKHRTGWFVSDRFQPEGKVVIYQYKFQDEKQYVSADDPLYLLKAAQLKVSRQATHIKEIEEILIQIPSTDEKYEMHFQLTDDVYYTQPDQFQSPEAHKLWLEWQRVSADLKDKQRLIGILRADFEIAEDRMEVLAITQEILSLEKAILRSRQWLDEKIKLIRNLEINYINEAL